MKSSLVLLPLNLNHWGWINWILMHGWYQPGESPYHTIHPGDTTLDSWNVTGLKQIRSNSWSDSLEDFRLGNAATGSTSNNRPLAGNLEIKTAVVNLDSIWSSVSVASIFPSMTNSTTGGSDQCEEPKDRDFRLLDPKFNYLCDNYRRCYADILYRWGLLEARCLVNVFFFLPIIFRFLVVFVRFLQDDKVFFQVVETIRFLTFLFEISFSISKFLEFEKWSDTIKPLSIYSKCQLNLLTVICLIFRCWNT